MTDPQLVTVDLLWYYYQCHVSEYRLAAYGIRFGSENNGGANPSILTRIWVMYWVRAILQKLLCEVQFLDCPLHKVFDLWWTIFLDQYILTLYGGLGKPRPFIKGVQYRKGRI